MSRVESADVELSTLQAPCLLAFLQQRTAQTEEQSRLVWSVFVLDSTCGQQHKTPSLVGNVQNSCSPRRMSILLPAVDSFPPLPNEVSQGNGEPSIGIWSHMVSMTNLWSDLQGYVSECAAGRTKLPWLLDSTYSVIDSQVLGIERTFLDVHRYETANFLQHSIDKISAE